MTDLNGQQRLAQLETLERALLEPKNRIDRQFMEAVLHPEFTEIGRSGHVYGREEIIDEIQSVTEFPEVYASNLSSKY